MWTLNLIPLVYVFIFILIPHVILITIGCSKIWNRKVGFFPFCSSSRLFSSYESLTFHMHFCIRYSKSSWILAGITFSLWVILGSVVILILLSLSVYEHRDVFPLALTLSKIFIVFSAQILHFVKFNQMFSISLVFFSYVKSSP